MIKSTFYNLPAEKRERITQAIINEFSSAKGEKVNISRIIKEANISRGSFYQYFDDKVDLVEVLIKTFAEFVDNKFAESLSLSHGDIFGTYINLFESVASADTDSKQRLMFENILKSLRANDNLLFNYLLNRFNSESFVDFSSRREKIDRSALKLKSDGDVDCLCRILAQISLGAMFELFLREKPLKSVSAGFRREIEIIRKGAAE